MMVVIIEVETLIAFGTRFQSEKPMSLSRSHLAESSIDRGRFSPRGILFTDEGEGLSLSLFFSLIVLMMKIFPCSSVCRFLHP